MKMNIWFLLLLAVQVLTLAIPLPQKYDETLKPTKTGVASVNPANKTRTKQKPGLTTSDKVIDVNKMPETESMLSEDSAPRCIWSPRFWAKKARKQYKRWKVALSKNQAVPLASPQEKLQRTLEKGRSVLTLLGEAHDPFSRQFIYDHDWRDTGVRRPMNSWDEFLIS